LIAIPKKEVNNIDQEAKIKKIFDDLQEDDQLSESDDKLLRKVIGQTDLPLA
jgi:hypothetical protein